MLAEFIVSYHLPDYSKHLDIWPEPRANLQSGGQGRNEIFGLKVTFSPGTNPRVRGRVVSLVAEGDAAAGTASSEAREYELEIQLDLPGGPNPSAKIPLRPRERERIYIDFLESGEDFDVTGNLVPIELSCRWVTPKTKIQEFLEYQYPLVYGPQKTAPSRDGGTTQEIVFSANWGRGADGPKTMVSRSGVYGPCDVCVSFVNNFMAYWNNFKSRGQGWFIAGNTSAIATRYATVLELAGRKNWPQLLTFVESAPNDESDIYVCGSSGHVWLVMHLGGEREVDKKYIYGFGQSWEDENSARDWFTQPCEPGWYRIHASGPAATPNKRKLTATGIPASRRGTLTIFSGAALTTNQLLNGVIAGMKTRRKRDRATRPPPASQAVPASNPRYSQTETFEDLADNLQARYDQDPKKTGFKIFAGTPLPWMNGRVFLHNGVAKTAYTLTPGLPDDDGVISHNEVGAELSQTRTFQVYKLTTSLDPTTGWSQTAWQRNRDVRPIVWKNLPHHGIDDAPP